MRCALIICTVLVLAIMNVPQSTEGDALDIGTKVSWSGPIMNHYTFSTGIIVETYADYHLHGDTYINYVPLIFDGNLSTGMNASLGPSFDDMWINIYFPYPFYVTNITTFPNFASGSTEYYLDIYFDYAQSYQLCVKETSQRVFHINESLTGISVYMDDKGTNTFKFNDIIVNYTAAPTNVSEISKALVTLTNIVNSLASQVSNMTTILQSLQDFVTELNITWGDLNITQGWIIENITKLWSAFQGLNLTMESMSNTFESFNETTYEKFESISVQMSLLEMTILSIQNDIINIEEKSTDMVVLQERINSTLVQLNELKTNITILEAGFHEKYDPSSLEATVLTLEQENILLREEIALLRSDIENLTASGDSRDQWISDIEDNTNSVMVQTELIDEEVDALNSGLINYSQPGLGADSAQKETVVEKDPDNTLSMVAIIIGVLGVTLAVIGAVMVVSVRRKLGAMEGANRQPIAEPPPEVPNSGSDEMKP